MAINKANVKVVSETVEINKKISFMLTDLIVEFGSVEVIKPADAFLLGAIKAVQASCNYLADVAEGMDKQTKPIAKPQQLEPVKE